jgi:rhodanese-related sulfurtransferase
MAKTAKDYLEEANALVPAIDAAAARKLVGDPNVIFLDVREPPELSQTGRIPGALHIPRGLLEFQADPGSPAFNPHLNQTTKIIINCASGGRSALAGKTLQEMGYVNVYNLTGGMTAWLQGGGPVEKT